MWPGEATVSSSPDRQLHGKALQGTGGGPACHVVDATVFEFSTDGRTRAWSDEADLAAIVRTELVPVIEQVLDELDSGGETLRIGNLDIDLGVLVLDGGWPPVRQRLREELQLALRNAQPLPGASQDRRPEAHRPAETPVADYELSRHYLLFGLLPHDIRILQEPEMQRRMLAASRSHPDQLLALMRQAATGQTVIARLIGQYPDSVLQRLAGTLNPSVGPQLAEFVGLLQSAIEGMKSTPKPAEEFRWLLWSRVFGELASNHQVTIESLSRELVAMLASALACLPSVLVQRLNEKAPASGSLASVVRDLIEHGDTRVPGSEVLLGSQPAGHPPGGMTAHSNGNGSEAGHRSGGKQPSETDAGLGPLLAALEQRQMGASDRLLDRLASDPIGFRAVARTLTTAVYRELLEKLLRRTGGEQGIALFLPAVAQHAGRSADEQAFHRLVFERLLRSEPVDLESIAREIAQPANKGSAAPVLDSRPRMTDGVSEVEAPGTADDETWPVYARAEHAPALAEVSPGGDLSAVLPASRNLIRGYDLYALLTGKQAQAPNAAGDWIVELARVSPTLLQRLLLELRSGVIALPRLSAALDGAALRALVHVLVPLATGCAEPDCRRLRQAIARHADQADKQRDFHQRLLQCLVDRKVIDLEAIASRSDDRAESYAIERQPAGRGGEVHTTAKVDRDVITGEGAGQAVDSVEPGQSEQALVDYLRAGVRPADTGTQGFREFLTHLILAAPESVTDLLQKLDGNEPALARLVELLPERLLTRMLYALNPALHAPIQRAADVVADACYAMPGDFDPLQVNSLKWQYCTRYLLESETAHNDTVFAQGLVEYLALHSGYSDDAQLHGLLQQQAIELDPSSATLFQAEDDPESAPEAVALHATQPVEDSRIDPDALQAEYREVLARGVVVGNAGLVLTAPYLPRLFDLLGLLDKGRFSGPGAQLRAARLLQFLVDERGDAPDYMLALNKVLCGLDMKQSVHRDIDVTNSEREAIEGLLKGMIENWKALKSTSINGLRESFLKRGGILSHDHVGWRLQVEPKAFDMLLEQLPWSYSIIKHAWMEEVIHVDWR